MNDYIDLFEKNILKDQKMLTNAFLYSRESITKYLHDLKLTFSSDIDFLKSEQVQLIWSLYSNGIKDGKLNDQYFRKEKESFIYDSSNFLTFNVFNEKDTFFLITGQEMNYLTTENLWQYLLNEERTHFNINVPPAFILRFFNPELLNGSLFRKLKFNIHEDSSLSEYFDDNMGLLTKLPLWKLTSGISNYIDNRRHSKRNLIHELSNIILNHYNSPDPLHVANKIDSRSFIVSIWLIIDEKGLDFFLNTYNSYFFDDWSAKKDNLHMMRSILFVDSIKNIFLDNYEKYEDLIIRVLMDLNKYEMKFNTFFQYYNNNEGIFFKLVDKLKEMNSYFCVNDLKFLNNASDEMSLYVLKEYKMFHSENVNLDLMFKRLKNDFSEEGNKITYEKLISHCSKSTYYSLFSIFGERLLHDKKLIHFIITNKNDFFFISFRRVILNNVIEDYEIFESLNTKAIKSLIEYYNKNCYQVTKLDTKEKHVIGE